MTAEVTSRAVHHGSFWLQVPDTPQYQTYTREDLDITQVSVFGARPAKAEQLVKSLPECPPVSPMPQSTGAAGEL
jgi:hypothetical protein